MDDFISQLIDIALDTTNESLHTSAVRMIGSVVNKWKDGKSRNGAILGVQ